MSTQDPPDRRDADRRREEGPYDGPERRVGDRRLPTGPPGVPLDATTLSDIDLLRAYQRAEPAAAVALLAEVRRRGLEP